MKRLNYISFSMVMVGLTLAVMSITAMVQAFYDDNAAEEYVLTIGGEELRFWAQPEAGYVFKTQEKTAGISTLSSTLSFLRAENAIPIRGLGRRGVWLIEDKRPAGENEKIIKMLKADRRIEYAAPLFSLNGETVAVIPEIVIRVKPGIDERGVHFLCQSLALAIIKPMEFTTQEYLLQVLGPDAEAVFTAVEQLNEFDSIEWACPNTAFQPKLGDRDVPGVVDSGKQSRISSAREDSNAPGVFPNDEYFPKQWHLHNTGQSGGTPGADINAPKAWEITTGDPNIVVAVMDCGVDSRHPDLINNLVPGYDFIENDDLPNPLAGYWGNAHGTACAGLIAAEGNNGIGVVGVTWNCKIMPIRIFGFRDDGTVLWLTETEHATALRWAASHGADILSNSWGEGNAPAPIIHSGIVDVTKAAGAGRRGKGCIVLFGAGNGSAPITMYPQRYPEVIAVGATDPCDIRWHYSSYGPELDIVAPSGCWTGRCAVPTPMWTTDIVGRGGWDQDNILDVNILDYTDAMEGTSGACPVAAGMAALILSVEPNLTSDEVRHFLERTAKDLGAPGRDDYYGWGRVDAKAALDMVLSKRADLNDDWKVDEKDLAILNTAIDTNDLSADIAPAAKRDGKVDQQDLDLLMRYLGKVIPELGLIAHWKLDEGEGEVAHNSTGDPKYNADLHGGPLWQLTAGVIDGALQLDGVDDYVSTPFVLNPAEGAFSVFAWVKDGVPGQVIISQKSGANWLLTDPSAGKLMTKLMPPAGRVAPPPLVSEFVITDGQWHRAGFVWDGTNRILYVDDKEVARDAQASLEGSIGGLHIGAGKTLESGSFWSGLIDNVRIFNRAITP